MNAAAYTTDHATQRQTMKTLFFASLLVAVLVAMPATAPQRTGTCRPADGFSGDFRSWISHTVKDTSWYARESRGRAVLPYDPAATIALISDPSVCAALATQFARTFAGRDTVNVNDVIAVTVDSAYYVVTDHVGSSPPVIERNPDGSLTYRHGTSNLVDAMTINRSQGTASAWKWAQLSGRPTPY